MAILDTVKETLDNVSNDLNGRFGEVLENFESFKSEFEKEAKTQGENIKVYRSKLEGKVNEVLNVENLKGNVQEEVAGAIKDVRTNVDKAYEFLKGSLMKAK